jgi:hypothetical protein
MAWPWHWEVSGACVYTRTHTVLRLYQGSIKAPIRLRQGCGTALLRLYQRSITRAGATALAKCHQGTGDRERQRRTNTA